MRRLNRTMARIHAHRRHPIALTAGTARLLAHFLAAMLNCWAAAASLEPTGSGSRGASVIHSHNPEFTVRMAARAQAPALADSLEPAAGARMNPEDLLAYFRAGPMAGVVASDATNNARSRPDP